MKRGENLTFGENRGGTKSSEKFGNLDFLDSLHLLKLGVKCGTTFLRNPPQTTALCLV